MSAGSANPASKLVKVVFVFALLYPEVSSKLAKDLLVMFHIFYCLYAIAVGFDALDCQWKGSKDKAGDFKTRHDKLRN